MFTLFRRIREKLIASGSVSKYLLYAIGEIMLVVIGILIALQVNNLNENRKIANEEQTILVQLLEDLEFAKVQSEVFIGLEMEDVDGLKLVLSSEWLKNEIFEQQNKDQLFYDVFWDLSSSVPVIIAFEDLQSAGNTGKINSMELRKALSEMELSIQQLVFILDDRLAVHQNRIDNIIEYEVNYLPLLAAERNLTDIDIGLANDYYQIMQKPNIRNLLGVKLDLTYTVLQRRQELDDKLAEIIERVKSEID